MTNDDDDSTRLCMSRRHFLFASSGALVLTALPGFASGTQLATAEYPRKKIASLSKLKQDVPVDFQYPENLPASSFFVVKLGEQAGGGLGKNKDIVAFSYLCPHMGGPLNGTYKSVDKAIGPCPMHLTTFDLTRHGMVIAGHATESLPQAKLEIIGDDIYAVGVMGLIYGTEDNLMRG